MASAASLYEELRNKNLQDNKEILEKLMADLQGIQGIKKVRAPAKATRKSRNSDVGPIRRNPSRQARQSLEGASYMRRRRGSTSSSISSVSTSSSASTSPTTSPNKLKVRFGFFNKSVGGRNDDTESGSDDNEEEDFELPVRAKNIKRYEVDTRSADEITEEDLALVAVFVSEKKYDSFFGTSCHQCRQKTNDMKTICRSGHCFGVRGQFCGPCLRNRYGEDAKEALKNDEWKCPPCRGICNCSFCRKKQGKACTGILIHLARERGFTSVNDYLQSLKTT